MTMSGETQEFVGAGWQSACLAGLHEASARHVMEIAALPA